MTLRSLSLPVSINEPSLAHRLRICDVIGLHAHALDQARENLGMRRAADSPSGEINEQRKPALEYRLDMWKGLVMAATVLGAATTITTKTEGSIILKQSVKRWRRTVYRICHYMRGF